jgi:sugar-specific transcriptional regulator TrmB
MSKKILKNIMNIGLSEREAQVYLATLENGTSVVSDIAKTAGYNRITTYTILEKLLLRGLVTQTNKKDMKHFTAIAPEIFAKDVMQRARDFKQDLPLLKSLSGGNESRPVVQFFEGLEGVKKAYQETLKSRTEILNYANSKNLREHWPDYDDEYVSKRAKKKKFLRGLAPDDEPGCMVRADDKKYFREIRLLSQKLFWVENEINIFDDKLLITSFSPQVFAILIQSKAVADTQRQIFEMSWTFAKKVT